MTGYTLSVVQLCPDQHRNAANAIAEAIGYGPNNLSVKLIHNDGSTWWGCHAWWIPSVFARDTQSNNPEVVAILASVITSAKEGVDANDHWRETLANNNLTVVVEE